MCIRDSASVTLVDVLEYSPIEVAEILGSTLAGIKSALHRGRVRLKAVAAAPEPVMPEIPDQERQRLRQYADHFNARDFDALRNLLADDVQLDLVNRLRLAGRKDVSEYFARYEAKTDWQFAVGVAEGRPALLVSDPNDPSANEYVVLLEWTADRVRAIRDFRFARYVTECLRIERV